MMAVLLPPASLVPSCGMKAVAPVLDCVHEAN